jgi:eukaryotic-like serine/threonine-protein kinase
MAPRDTPELPEGLNLLDRYTIIDRVAAGGMADIYRAHDSRLDRIVCVKLLRNVIEGSGSGGIIYQATYTHFLQEARALSKLAHPNTLRIYDFGFLQDESARESGEFASRPFQISEYLDGGNLETYVRSRGPLRPAWVLAIVDRIAGAIAEAHGAGIIHRDIKPSNILFSHVGEVLMPKLADFGIARRARKVRASADAPGGVPQADDSADTLPPVPLFSPRWAAPEQLSSSDEGPTTDVYALGLVVAFMLAGQGLFEVPKIDSTYTERVSGDAYVRSRLALHTFTPEVARALMAALRADPRVRTQSPFELYEALSVAFGTPRATLPTLVSHSGGVPSIPPPRAQNDSISVEVAFKGSSGDPRPSQAIEPPEQWLEVDGRKVRLVETHEKLDLSYPSGPGADVRFRVTLLPARGSQFSVNFKGLSCFIGKPGGHASPALVTDTDGAADLVSSRKERLGGLTWSFGTVRSAPGGSARVFPIARGELVVPFPHGERAILVELAPEREVIVICRRA